MPGIGIGLRGVGGVALPTLCKGVGWNPLMLGADLLAWWSADDLSSLTLVSTAVSSWRDRKNGYDAAQGVGAARPIYSASGFNGAPGLYFDGVDDCLSLESQPFPSGSSPSELHGVLDQQSLAASTGTRSAVTYGGTGSDLRALRRVVSSGVNRGRASVGDGASVLNADGGTVDFSGRHTMRGIFSATEVNLVMDADASVAVSAVPATGTTRLRIGASAVSSPTTFWQGQVRDIIVTAALSTEKAALLAAWKLNQRRV